MMLSTTLVAAFAALSVAAPASFAKRQLSADDTEVLQLAHFLENLEFNLYSGGCDGFTDDQYTAAGFPAGFRELICLIAQQEGVHRDTLAQVLTQNGQTPLPPCTYSFPYSDPVSFVDVANMITTAGLGAYLGGAMLIQDNPMLLTEAASILTTEARHDAINRAGLGGSPFPTPFDTALSALWAYNLADQFVVSCPQQLPGVVALPKLMVTSPTPQPHLQPPVSAGTPISFKWDPSTFFVSVDPNAPLYIAIVNQNVEEVMFEQVQNLNYAAGTGQIPLPSNVSGIAFAALTTFSGGLDLNSLSQYGTLAGPTEIVIS